MRICPLTSQNYRNIPRWGIFFHKWPWIFQFKLNSITCPIWWNFFFIFFHFFSKLWTVVQNEVSTVPFSFSQYSLEFLSGQSHNSPSLLCIISIQQVVPERGLSFLKIYPSWAYGITRFSRGFMYHQTFTCLWHKIYLLES